MAQVQPIFQNPFEAFNPLKHVDRYLLVHGAALLGARRGAPAQAAADAALRKVGLSFEEVTRRFPHELSGGQLQRVAIARALIPEPALIVADEPVSMVDASLRMSIVNLFRTLRDELGVSIIYITHDLATAYYISDRIIVMEKGVVVEGGDARAVLDDPQHPYTRRLKASVLSAEPPGRRRRGTIRPSPIRPHLTPFQLRERQTMHDAKLTLDRSDTIGTPTRRLFGAFVEHLGRCVYGGLFEPGPSDGDQGGLPRRRAGAGARARARRSSATRAATSSPATTGRTASARSRTGRGSSTSPGSRSSRTPSAPTSSWTGAAPPISSR